ncbi:MAG: STAS domain-containing protein [Magnetococcus sp. WYHC-3]
MSDIEVQCDPYQNQLTLVLPPHMGYALHRSFRRCYENEPRNRKVRIDMSRMRHIDSATIGMLLMLLEHFNASADSVQLVGIQPPVARVLELCKLQHHFKLLPVATIQRSVA